MVRETVSPALWVQRAQALVARELVTGLGLPVRRAAQLLGLSPAAVSQYLTGKRHPTLLPLAPGEEGSVSLARELAERLSSEAPTPGRAHGLLLGMAARMAEGDVPGWAPPRGAPRGAVPPRPGPSLAHDLRRRVAAEQAAVTECMRLAQKARDELTRALFRQIASDSLRHAEIVASLAPYLDRGIGTTLSSGIRRSDVERLIARERVAEAGSVSFVERGLGGTMALLAASMEADERKHEQLLEGLLQGFPPSSQGRPPGRRPRGGPVAARP